MADIASKLSDYVVLTSDNPRMEDPMVILKQMEEGIPTEKKLAYTVIEDRHEAIRKAFQELAKAGDIVLVAGKGHETYQEINGVRHDFDDMQIVKELLELLNK